MAENDDNKNPENEAEAPEEGANAQFKRWMRENWIAVLFAAIGGVLPSTVTWLEFLLGDTTHASLPIHLDFYSILRYSAGIALSAFLGGFVGMIAKEQIPQKAVVLGIAAPALITIWHADVAKLSTPLPSVESKQNATQVKQTKEEQPTALADPFESTTPTPTPKPTTDRRSLNQQHWNFVLLPEAHAQTVTDGNVSGKPNRFIEVYASRESISFSVQFLQENEQFIRSENLHPGDSRRIPVPPNATLIQIQREKNISPTIPIPQPPNILAVEVEARAEIKLGFQSAFGSEAVEYAFKLKTSSVKLASPKTRGWIYVGKWDEDTQSWTALFVTLSPVSLPKKDDLVVVKFPLRLRTAPPDGDQVATVRIGQRVKILDSKQTEQAHYWAEIEVVE